VTPEKYEIGEARSNTHASSQHPAWKLGIKDEDEESIGDNVSEKRK
jgi:hypothetical protein